MNDLAAGTKVQYQVNDEQGIFTGIIQYDNQNRMYIQDLNREQVIYYPAAGDIVKVL